MNDPHIVISVASDERLPVFITGDWHVGAETHDATLLDSHLARAAQIGARGIHLGDGPEQVGALDKVAGAGALWTQKQPPIEQRRILAEKISRVKFDVLFPGNHDRRVDAKHGISYVETVVDKANLLRAERGDPHRSQWMPRPGFVTYQVGGQSYTFFLHHGEGPVINPFTLHTRITAGREGMDAILTGHIHKLAIKPVVVRGAGTERTLYWVRAGHYLANPEYAAIRPIAIEGAMGSVVLWLDPKEHRITPELWLTGSEPMPA